MTDNIIYWKWNADAIENEAYLDAETDALASRCRFSLVYISLHHTNYRYNDPAVKKALRFAAEKLKKSGAKIVLDIDIRQEYDRFILENPGREAQIIVYISGRLDSGGRAAATEKNKYFGREGKGGKLCAPASVLGAWSFSKTGGSTFDKKTLSPVKTEYRDNGDTTTFNFCGAANAYFTAAVCYSIRSVDISANEIYPYYRKMIEHFADLPLGGIANDEWGFDPQIESDEYRLYITKSIPYSGNIEERFLAEYGKSIKDNALYLAYAAESDPFYSYSFVNEYTEFIRANMKNNNDWFYAEGKRIFGSDAFIGVHPTYWGDPYDCSPDIWHNGLDWWEVKRDYAQTDEYCVMPVRLALAHKWGGKVWYNMWYSGGTQQVHTFFEEAWKSLKFGGRLHYLGWDCPNELGVYNLRNPNSAESVAQTEKLIARADACINALPSSRLLIVFGVEGVTNWLFNYGGARIVRGTGGINKVLQFAQGVFDFCNCDLVPDYEITNGSVVRTGGKLRYGVQEYAAAILIAPEFIRLGTLDFFAEYVAARGKFILCGGAKTDLNGGDISAKFNGLKRAAAYSFDELPTAKETALALKELNVPFGREGGGCVYTDGTVVFTADAHLASGNFFEFSRNVFGRAVSFCGNDFLVLNFADGKYACGDGSVLHIDGKPQNAGKIKL
jgi:hypothetical protein